MIKKIHWAVDPYSKLPEAKKRSFEALKILKANNPQAELIPIYFLGSDLIHWISNTPGYQYKEFEEVVSNDIKSQLGDFQELNLSEPQVIFGASSSLRRDAKVASQYLFENSSDLLVLNTHARKGLSRFFLGSFSESLLHQAKTPLLFVSPHTEPITKMERVLYPSDFSESDFTAFCTMLDEFAIKPQEIILYNKVISPIPSISLGHPQAPGYGTTLEGYIEDIAKTRRQKSEKWKQKATTLDIKVKVLIDETPGVFIDDLLATIKSMSVDAVMTASFVGGIEALLIGSVTRQLVRDCDIPVFVKHFNKSSDD